MPSAADFAAHLGLPIRDPELFGRALVHSSYLHEHRDAVGGHNERLEYLGDAVVSLAISTALYDLRAGRRRGCPLGPPGGDREHDRPGPAGQSTRPRHLAAPGRGRIAARRPAPAVAPGLGLRGRGRGRLPRPRLRSGPRLDRRRRRARARLGCRPGQPEEPQEPSPGAHPATGRRAPGLSPRRRVRAPTTSASSGSRSASVARSSAGAKGRRGGSPRRPPRRRRSRPLGGGPAGGAAERVGPVSE